MAELSRITSTTLITCRPKPTACHRHGSTTTKDFSGRRSSPRTEKAIKMDAAIPADQMACVWSFVFMASVLGFPALTLCLVGTSNFDRFFAY